MKFLIKSILLIPIALSILCFGQNSEVLGLQDSTKLTLEELKQTLSLLNELEYRREEKNIFLDKENIYKNVIQDYKASEELYKQKITNYEIMVEAVKPKWYNNFWVGATASAIVSTAIYLLVR